MAARPGSIPVDEIESLLCCCICLEPIQDPRTLPCFHSYCKHCLENYVAKHRERAAKAKKKIEEFECPTCRSPFPLKEHEEVANIRGSHFIRNMIDVLNAIDKTNVWKCSNHSEKPSCCRCVSCEKFLCEECLKMHENWPEFKDHSVLTTEELKKPENQSKITAAMRCNEHATKKLKFYCETCDVLICRYCMDFEHVRPDHVCHPIEKVVEKHRQALQGCCDVLNEKQAKGEKSLKDVTDAEEALEKTATQAKANLSKQKNDIQRVVEIVFQRKINNVDELYAPKKKILAEQRNNVEFFLDHVKCAGSLSEKVLEKGSDEEIIESRKLVEKRIKMVKESESLSHPRNVAQSWFKVKEVNIEMISTLLGEVALPMMFLNSSILENAEDIHQMSFWFEEEDHTWQLCYKASRDGWNAKYFHLNCKHKGPTVTLVKVNKNIFGGYIDVDWKDVTSHKSENAFMFSLKNKDNLPPFRAFVLEKMRTATRNEGLGPLFGEGGYLEGHDLFISKHPPTEPCYSDLGNAYKLPDGYGKGTDKARCLLAGSFNFTPSEIEVFFRKEKFGPE